MVCVATGPFFPVHVGFGLTFAVTPSTELPNLSEAECERTVPCVPNYRD
jgi:hypothetical protein